MSWSLAAFFGLCFLAAMSGGLFSPGPWYWALKKPSWQPPDWLFAPAWLVLYVMIAFAGWIVWESPPSLARDIGLGLYGIQLVLNALWSAIFFGMKRMGLAFVEVVFLWISVAATMAAFFVVDSTAGQLFVPYLAWVSFAAFLNLTVWRLNPEAEPRRS